MSTVALLNPICRGLIGHVSYLATCGSNEVYSEYLLYEPIARIAQSKGYKVRCEVPVGIKANRGDFQRIDFEFTKLNRSIALEVKWWNTKNSGDVTNDVTKLRASNSKDRFLLIFGTNKIVARRRAKLNGEALSWGGKIVHWDAGKTHYAARWIRV